MLVCKMCLGTKSYTHISPDGYRRCSKCKRELLASLDIFSPDPRRPDGFKSECRECRRLRRNQTARPILVSNGLRTCVTCKKEYPETNEFFHSRGHGRYHSLCKDCWYERYSLRGVLRLMKKRTEDAGALFSLTQSDWIVAVEYFNKGCAVCGKNVFDINGDTVLVPDHWQPIISGGNSTPVNIVPLCHGIGGCNPSKQDTDPHTWLVWRYGELQANIILARVEDYFAWVISQNEGAA